MQGRIHQLCGSCPNSVPTERAVSQTARAERGCNHSRGLQCGSVPPHRGPCAGAPPRARVQTNQPACTYQSPCRRFARAPGPVPGACAVRRRTRVNRSDDFAQPRPRPSCMMRARPRRATTPLHEVLARSTRYTHFYAHAGMHWAVGRTSPWTFLKDSVAVEIEV